MMDDTDASFSSSQKMTDNPEIDKIDNLENR